MTPGERRSDEALLEAAAGGDRAALRVLYERHAPWLFVRLSRRCADTSIVEDVVQDTFVAVWRRAQTYRGTGEVAAWIWGIGIRRLIDRLRRPPFPAFTFERERAEPSAEEKVLLAIEYGDLAPALQRLSPELRAVLQARVLDGLSTREAAALLRIPAGTVKTRLMRARAQLRRSLA
ncbi:MAG: RNA polymerase sigma factor [Actinobacteria bacterium]|nr:RNA polymerase sigma factor [Actinomycetota bacterium]